MVKGTTIGVTTGINGDYNIAAPPDATLTFSFLGMGTNDEAVGGRTRIDVVMGESSQAIDEVVVTALGIKRDRKTLGYAIEEVRGESLVNTREANVVNALSGKISGLQVIKASGTGASSKIVLRGNNSLTGNNQPLVVIDGIPVSNFLGGEGDVWGNNAGTDNGNGLGDVNTEDIESLTGIKGGSAAALYGSRAGNGVILITTKSGHKQEGLGINFSASISGQDIFIKPQLQDEFGQGTAGAFSATGRMSWGPKIEGQSVTAWNGKQENLAAYDNVSNFFSTGLIGTENLSLQQTFGKTQVMLYLHQ
jgi:TonB-dependent SusC/RagA subfamily outer membrane receptor